MIDALLQTFGRSHLLVLHLPIGLLMVAAMIEAFRIVKPRKAPAGVDPDSEQGQDLQRLLRQTPTPSAYTCVFFATLFGAAAATSGWIYAGGEFTNTNDLQWHRWLGVVAASLALLTLILGMVATLARVTLTTRLYKGSLLLAAVSVAWAGHLGGELVHGEGYVLEPLRAASISTPITPPSTPPATGHSHDNDHETNPATDQGNDESPLENPAQESLKATSPNGPANSQPELLPAAFSFENDIQPIFKRSCVKCHRRGKAKGDLMLDTLAESMYAIEPGDAANSILIELINLPESDEDSMPKDKPSLSAAHIQTLTDWINAMPSDFTPEDEPEPLPELEVRHVPGPTIETQPITLAFDAADQPIELTEEQTQARDTAITRLRSNLISASVRAAGLGTVEVRVFESRELFTDDHLAQLAGLEPCLTVLDLTGTQISDAGIKDLATRFTRLRILRLGQTAITDEALAALGSLTELSLLDLHQTSATAEGLAPLAALDSVRVINCWQTQATPDELADLAERFPDVEFQTGD